MSDNFSLCDSVVWEVLLCQRNLARSARHMMFVIFCLCDSIVYDVLLCQGFPGNIAIFLVFCRMIVFCPSYDVLVGQKGRGKSMKVYGKRLRREL